MSFKNKDRGTRKTAGEGVKRRDREDTGSDDSGSASSRELMELTLDDLARSGLDKADARRLKLAPLSRDETDEFVGEHRASYRIPYFDMEGREIAYSRVRFLESEKKKPFQSSGKFKSGNGSFRYSQPFNSTPHVYFPPYQNWKKISVDVSEKILITEGEKKAAIACKLGINCVALGGVYGFKSSKRLWDLIPELQNIDWKDRDVEICYDADVMVKAEVRAALTALAMTLSQNYAVKSISFIFLDAEVAGKKTGLDDFLVARGREEFDLLERQPFRAQAKIQLLNQKICYVERKGKFYGIQHDVWFGSFYHVREAFMNEGEELIDGKKTALVIDLWGKSSSRRAVKDVVYEPGLPEVTEDNELNVWRPSDVRPQKGKPKRWLELVEFIFQKPEYVKYLLQWLAYPVQNPGAKLYQSVFVHSRMQGTGKTLIVDPVMEFVYGAHNFHRLSNKDLKSQFNPHLKNKCFIACNEVYLPDFGDRKAIMGELKDMITREKVDVNVKYQPQQTLRDCANYYLTSQHEDALAIEPHDRRFFVIEGPNSKLPQSTYDEFDSWIRGEGSSVVLHYLLNSVDCSDFNPKGDALMTPAKKAIIGISKDPLMEFIDRLSEDAAGLMMTNGVMPDQHLYKAEDLLRKFELTYPKLRFIPTVARMGRALKASNALERRKVRLTDESAQQVLYAVFEKDQWRDRKNRDWAEHYRKHAKMFGGRQRS